MRGMNRKVIGGLNKGDDMNTNESNVLSKLETRFDEWLEKFEERPISTGIKVVIIVILLRLVWRSFK